MSKRELVQLAQTYDSNKHHIAGWYASEKLDGMRAWWDGGITRGLPAATIPFANTAKDHIRLQEVICTGLWSRYGHPIQAPDYFINVLPTGVPLDGELYIGPKMFQKTVSIVKKLVPDETEWLNIKYNIFDMPAYSRLFQDGTINNPNFKNKIVSFAECDSALNITQRGSGLYMRTFDEVVTALDGMIGLDTGFIDILWQEKLPSTVDLATDRMYELMDTVLAKGGEGLILRNPGSIWIPKRSWNLLKTKPSNDSEGTVVGYTWGKGKLSGMMGNLILNWYGKQFELSGFTDAERELVSAHSDGNFEGVMIGEVSKEVTNKQFPRGSKITFQYRELTDAGIPKEARYYRKA